MKGQKRKSTVRRAAVYCRVSTELEIQEGSFEWQKEYYLKKIADDPTLVLADIYGDFGKSGTSIRKRKEFQRMIRDCEDGKIDLIFTKSMSRFSRNLADCMETVRKLKDMGIAVFFEREGINTMDGANELLMSILATIAQEEVNSISQNVRWALERQHSRGKATGSVTYGYRRIMPEGNWIIEESEAKRVRFAFENAANGMCYQEIRAGLDAIEAENGSKYRWKNRNRLHYMLTNISYIGDIVTDKYYTIGPCNRYERKNRGERDRYYIEEHHEPLISKEMFDRVQLLMEHGLLHSNRRRYTEEERMILADTSWRNGSSDTQERGDYDGSN